MPLFWLSLAFLCGIIFGALSGEAVSLWLYKGALFLSAVLLILLLYELLQRSPSRLMSWLKSWWPANSETLLPGFVLPFLPLIFIFGVRSYWATLPVLSPMNIAWYSDRAEPYIIEGEVVVDPEFRDAYTQFEIEASSIQGKDTAIVTPVEGRLLVRLPAGGNWLYGDRVRLEGRLRTPAESQGFSYKKYLAHRGIYTTLSCPSCISCEPIQSKDCAWLLGRGGGSDLKRAIYALRRNAIGVISKLFPDPEAALLSGILLGIETNIPEDVINAFRLTGTAHIIAISGFNFAIIAGLLVRLFGGMLGPWRSLPVALIGIAVYAVLVGASAGVVRAAIMGSLGIFAVRVGRPSSGLNTLMFVAGLMALHNTHVLWDVSFQLSFMATLGLMLYAEPLSAGFTSLVNRWTSSQAAHSISGPLSSILLFTLAAQLTTLPLILYYFHQMPLISLLANLLVLPVQPALMVLGGLSTVAGLVILPLGRLLSFLAWPLIAYTIRVVELLAAVPGSAITIESMSFALVLGFYAVLLGGTLMGSRLRTIAARVNTGHVPFFGWVLYLGLALLMLVVWQRVFSLPDERLHLTVLDVDGGEAILIQTPSGRSLLVNGGPSPNALAEAIGRRMPVGGREIDYLIVGGTSEQQIGGLPLGLDRFQVRKVLWAGSKEAGNSARELPRRLAEDEIPVTDAQPGQTINLGDGAWLEVVAAAGRGVVLTIEWNRFRALLPLGMDFESQEALLRDPSLGEMTVLLLADGGHASLNSPEWIAHFKPRLALLSVETGNKEGLPHPETLDALEKIQLLRTDLNGWIEVSTDGEQMWVEVERK